MVYSKNANVSLKQSDLAHLITGLAYHWDKKLDDALLIPVCVAFIWLTEIFGANLLYAYALQIDWKPGSVYLMRFINWLEAGLHISMIYEWVQNWPLYIYDL